MCSEIPNKSSSFAKILTDVLYISFIFFKFSVFLMKQYILTVRKHSAKVSYFIPLLRLVSQIVLEFFPRRMYIWMSGFNNCINNV